MKAEPFEVHIPQVVLEDLQARLRTTRAIPDRDIDDWDAGASPAYLERLLRYWRTRFDWRTQEARLNEIPQFRVSMGETSVHFLYARGRGPRPFPLLLTHGFPDSFLRFVKILPLLTDPAAHGGNAEDAFDVVVPSLPGYAFSSPLPREGGLFQIGDLWHRLMVDVLGYPRFGAHGGDWGSTVTEHLARSHPGAVAGIHLTDVPFWHAFQKPSHPSPAEQVFFEANEKWQRTEGAYALLQGNRPQTLADGLNDSPVGLAAWLVEKFQRWSDNDGASLLPGAFNAFTPDELLTQVTLYWVTETIGTSFLPYYDILHAGAGRWMVEMAKQWIGSAKVPSAFALFPKDLSHPPREYAERFFHVDRWTEMPRGGHFAAMETPELLAEDLRAFFRPLRTPMH